MYNYNLVERIRNINRVLPYSPIAYISLEENPFWSISLQTCIYFIFLNHLYRTNNILISYFSSWGHCLQEIELFWEPRCRLMFLLMWCRLGTLHNELCPCLKCGSFRRSRDPLWAAHCLVNVCKQHKDDHGLFQLPTQDCVRILRTKNQVQLNVDYNFQASSLFSRQHDGGLGC